jgi:hypothetical protein
VIAGGGVAAVEALLALRQLAGRNVAIDLIAPERDFLDRPSSVAIPFGFGMPEPLDLEALAARMDAGFQRATLIGVDRERSVAWLAGGGEAPYDRLPGHRPPARSRTRDARGPQRGRDGTGPRPRGRARAGAADGRRGRPGRRPAPGPARARRCARAQWRRAAAALRRAPTAGRTS